MAIIGVHLVNFLFMNETKSRQIRELQSFKIHEEVAHPVLKRRDREAWTSVLYDGYTHQEGGPSSGRRRMEEGLERVCFGVLRADLDIKCEIAAQLQALLDKCWMHVTGDPRPKTCGAPHQRSMVLGQVRPF